MLTIRTYVAISRVFEANDFTVVHTVVSINAPDHGEQYLKKE